MTTLHKLTPNLMVESVDETLQFYRDVLGYTINATAPEERPFNWASLERDGVSFMFQSRESLAEELPAFQQAPLGASLTFFIFISGLEELYAQVKERAHILKPPYTTFYNMREFVLSDNNGYLLVFAEEIKA